MLRQKWTDDQLANLALWEEKKASIIRALKVNMALGICPDNWRVPDGLSVGNHVAGDYRSIRIRLNERSVPVLFRPGTKISEMLVQLIGPKPKREWYRQSNRQAARRGKLLAFT